MARAYSLDLRRKVFAAWQHGERSQAEVAARFGVSESFVGDLAALHRQTGGVAARPARWRATSLATPAALAHLSGLVANNDHTIAEHHAGMLAAGFTLSAATVGRMLLRLRQTRKKRRSRTTRPAANG